MEISNVRCVGDIKKEELCIVVYSLDKMLIFFGEKLFLEFIGGWFCDVREDIVMLGFWRCFMNCLFFSDNYFMKGCSIGNFLGNGLGFVGFFYKLINLINIFGSGFFIVLYVVVYWFEFLYN